MIIYNENNYQLDFEFEKLFKKLLKETIKQTSQEFKEFFVHFVDENEIHDINKKARKIDRVTDVITFRCDDNQMYNPIQGEMYICIPVAIKQAQEYGHSLKREVCFLFVHGLLHLLGYDHMNEADEKVMFGLQDKILAHQKIER